MSTRSANNPRNLNGGKTGVSKKSAARAKPKAAAASSVRMDASTANGRALTQSERKAKEREQRNDANRNLVASNILLKKDPVYRRNRTIWGTMLAVGLSMTILSWIILLTTPEAQRTIDHTPGKLSLAALVLAYVLVIGAFIFDFVKVRKQRIAVEDKVASMSEKRVEEIIKKEAFAREAKKRSRKLFGSSSATKVAVKESTTEDADAKETATKKTLTDGQEDAS